MLTRSSLVLIAVHEKAVSLYFQLFSRYVFFQLFLQNQPDLEESTDEDDELKEINKGNRIIIQFYSAA